MKIFTSTRIIVIALGLGSMLVAQAVCLGVAIWLPRPAPPTVSFAEAIAVIRGETAAEEVGLIAWTQAGVSPETNDAGFSQLLADELGVPGSHVRVQWWRPDSAPDGRHLGATSSPGSADALASPLRELLIGRALRWPAFKLSLKQPDGLWRVVTVVHDDTWSRHYMAAILLCGAILSPLILLVAMRVTRPLTDLASRVRGLGPEGQAALPESGPEEVAALAESINALRERVAEQARSTTRMLAAVAHDLRTPLTSLRIRAESAPEKEAARMARDIARMGSMIDQVLAYARSESAAMAWSTIDVGAMLDDLVADMASRGCEVACEHSAKINLHGDELLIRRAIQNLLENACRYASDVSVSARKSARAIQVEIADRGTGILREDRDRLLLPFERGDRSRSAHSGGSGLGLAIAQSAARRHGGTLELLEREGGGLVARLSIPMVGVSGQLANGRKS